MTLSVNQFYNGVNRLIPNAYDKKYIRRYWNIEQRNSNEMDYKKFCKLFNQRKFRLKKPAKAKNSITSKSATLPNYKTFKKS